MWRQADQAAQACNTSSNSGHTSTRSSGPHTTSSGSIPAVRPPPSFPPHKPPLLPLKRAPPGISFSTPPIAIFTSPPEALALLGTYALSANESASALGRNYAIWELLSEVAAGREEVRTVLESVSTPAVAMDMLGIARAFGFEEVSYWGVS